METEQEVLDYLASTAKTAEIAVSQDLHAEIQIVKIRINNMERERKSLQGIASVDKKTEIRRITKDELEPLIRCFNNLWDCRSWISQPLGVSLTPG